MRKKPVKAPRLTPIPNPEENVNPEISKKKVDEEKLEPPILEESITITDIDDEDLTIDSEIYSEDTTLESEEFINHSEDVRNGQIHENKDVVSDDIITAGQNESPLELNTSYEFDSKTSYFFMFGTSSSGKTVIISSLLWYLRTIRSARFGDGLVLRNDREVDYEHKGMVLWKELQDSMKTKQFPGGTQALSSNTPIPRHIFLNFEPSSDDNEEFPFCLMDMSGEDLQKVEYSSSNRRLDDGIKLFISSMPKENMCFICVLDPKSPQWSDAEMSSYTSAFIDELDRNGHKSTPLLFLVSKWDLVKDDYADVDEYLKLMYPEIWGALNQKGRNVSYTTFTIGEVNHEENSFEYDPKPAKTLFDWMYYSQKNKKLIHSAHSSKRKKGIKSLFKK